MKNERFMPLEDLEVLAQAYLDCRLSRQEELELRLVLFSADITSPLLQEVRCEMERDALIEKAFFPGTDRSVSLTLFPSGVEAVEAGSSTPRADARLEHPLWLYGRMKKIRRWAVAASVIMILGLTVLIGLRHGSVNSEPVLLADGSKASVSVIVNGEVLSGEAAKEIALRSMAASMAMIDEVKAFSETERINSLNMINSLKSER